MRFCPMCGKQGIKGAFCSECANKEFCLKEMKLKTCYSCEKKFSEGKWQKGSLSEVIKKSALKNIRGKRKPALRISFDEKKKGPGLIVQGELVVAEQQVLPFEVQYTYCTQCALGKSQYFEGVLQVRKPTESIISFIKQALEHAKKKGVFATKTKEVTNGLDFYTTSNAFVQQLGNKLKKTFGGTLKVNPRLFSREKQTSKEIHRVATLYESPPYTIGDVVSFDNLLLKITTTGKQLGGLDLVSGKKVKVESKHVYPEKMLLQKVTVTKKHPSPEVMDPETFQSIPLKTYKPLDKENVCVVILKGVAYQV